MTFNFKKDIPNYNRQHHAGMDHLVHLDDEQWTVYQNFLKEMVLMTTDHSSALCFVYLKPKITNQTSSRNTRLSVILSYLSPELDGYPGLCLHDLFDTKIFN